MVDDSPSRTLEPGSLSLGPVVFFAFLIGTTIFLFEPAKSVFLNSEEIHSDAWGVLRALIAPWLLGSCLFVVLAVVLHRIMRGQALGILIAVAVALWVQANLFVWHYGEMDGTAIDWKAHAGKGWVEAVVWVSLLFIGFFWARRVAPHWKPIAIVLLLLYGVAIFSAIGERSQAELEDSIAEASSDIDFSLYSQDRNVIVIVLDGLQSDVFAQALGDPDTSSILPPGFTYYRNAISLYVRTQFSLPTTLSGEAAPSGGNLSEWGTKTSQTWLPARLAKEGWRSALMSFAAFLRMCREGEMQDCVHPNTLMSSSSAAGERRIERQEASEILLLSLFRSVPHVVKPLVYDDGEWQLPLLLESEGLQPRDSRILEATRLDLDVMDRLILDARSGDIAPQFRLIHLHGLHFPAKLDQDCDYPDQKYPNGRTHLVETTQCLMNRVSEFLWRLDELGVYDNSFIAIVADHGTPAQPVDFSGVIPPIPKQDDGAKVYLDNTYRGLPLFLIKNFDDREPIRVSDLPVSLCDLPATVYDALEMNNDTSCLSVLSVTEDRPLRVHYRYATYAEQKAMTPEERNSLTFRAYVVDGHSWRPESWKPREGQ